MKRWIIKNAFLFCIYSSQTDLRVISFVIIVRRVTMLFAGGKMRREEKQKKQEKDILREVELYEGHEMMMDKLFW